LWKTVTDGEAAEPAPRLVPAHAVAAE
jgi:hypothetical protein